MTSTRRLPSPEKRELTLGYLRLTDSAPLIMAQELGLYEHYGLTVQLQQEVSWANVRDKLVHGDIDAAQMLAPLPLATSLGAGGMRADVITGLALSLSGNAITVSPALAGEIAGHGGGVHDGARSTAQALGVYLKSSGGSAALTFATAHSFSCHTFLLRRWLAAGGIDPECDLRIIVLPPEQMVDSLARGVIDGYCVGEPWNSIAVQYGVGVIQATGYQIWNNGLEKVLGVTGHWHRLHPASHLRLRLALMEACSWLASPEHREQAATVLARPQYLDLPENSLLPSLSGELVFAKGEPAPAVLADFHVFGRYQAGFPWRSDGEWLLREIAVVLGKVLETEQVKAMVQQSFRTDLYREAARLLQMPCPDTDYRPANQHREPWELQPDIHLGPDMLLGS